MVSAYDKGSLQAIERAIRSSDLGLSPNNDGRLIRIPIPPLTEERRKELVQHVKKVAEEHKIGVRDARRAALGMLKDLEGDGSLPADDRVRADKKVEELTAAHVKKIDEMCSPEGTGDPPGLSHGRSRTPPGRAPAPRRRHHGRQRAVGGAPRARRGARATAPASRRCAR